MATSALASLLFKENQISAIKWFCIAVAMIGLVLPPISKILSENSVIDPGEIWYLVVIAVAAALSAISAVF